MNDFLQNFNFRPKTRKNYNMKFDILICLRHTSLELNKTCLYSNKNAVTKWKMKKMSRKCL